MRYRYSRLNICLRLLLAISGLLIASRTQVNKGKYPDSSSLESAGSMAVQRELFAEKIKIKS